MNNYIKVFIILFLSGFTLYIYNLEPNYIHPELKPYYNSFKKECKNYNISTFNLKFIDSINYGELEEGILGRCDYSNSKVIIHNKMKYNKGLTNLEFLVYHELAHVLNIDHDTFCCEIMSVSLGIDNGSDLERYTNYKKYKKRFFNYIKQNQ